MAAEAGRKRGAPRGNQNARKHGFYSRILHEDKRLYFVMTLVVGQPVGSFIRQSLWARPTHGGRR